MRCLFLFWKELSRSWHLIRVDPISAGALSYPVSSTSRVFPIVVQPHTLIPQFLDKLLRSEYCKKINLTVYKIFKINILRIIMFGQMSNIVIFSSLFKKNAYIANERNELWKGSALGTDSR